VEGGDDFQTMTLLDRIALRTEVNAELLEPGDLANYQREQTTARVRLTLDEMGPQQAEILRYTYGIAGRPLCEKDSEAVSVAVSAAVGPITPARVPVVRFKASETFAKRYASRVAGTVEERDEWLAAAAGVKAARK
jgi:hypothetical protein